MYAYAAMNDIISVTEELAEGFSQNEDYANLSNSANTLCWIHLQTESDNHYSRKMSVGILMNNI